ncbi:AMP-binding protein [Aestuariibacter sp. AA17]|uniref:AMP-binding protein n=1 Tax=Fluctibacter corallii TaxID=2984329 RepID=A0ABT3ACL7_9ALTE|nr:AMP-binding protein [Aestuariibacter sp. AA17]MCV2886421.1 AMP-binding protein [Aestuariibacter sp. AA17]
MSLITPLESFYQQVEKRPDKIFLKQPVDGDIKTYTWKGFDDQVRRVAAGLHKLGLEKGSHISILSKNCAEWFIADMAIMLAGCVSVPIFPTAGKDTIQYVLKHAGCKAIFMGKLDDADAQFAAIPDEVPTIGFSYVKDMANISWAEMLEHEPLEGNPIPDLDDVMTIIYTSGSTGNPKGVVHPYRSISWAASNSLKELNVDENDRILSYLPLAHITERVLIESASFYSASEIHFLESLDTFQRDIKWCDPTLFVSVPRLWTRFQMGVLAKMPQKKLNILLSIPIINKIVAKKIREQLGLNSARLCASGSAPISPSTIRWFARIGVQISEGWGMTENSAYGTSCVPFRLDKVGSIGRPYEGVTLRISEDGELQVKGPCNMREYYLEPEKTAEVFTEDGFLRTGDKGEIDNEGYVRITGRLKDIFKTAKGKYVTPVPIESLLMENSNIEQVCVTGSSLKQPIALVVLSDEAKTLPKDEIEVSLRKTLEKVNGKLESHQVLDRIVVLEEPWTIENNLLTPTLKVKRHVIEEKLDGVINQNHKGDVVFA